METIEVVLKLILAIALGGIISIILITINKLARAYIEKADNDDSN